MASFSPVALCVLLACSVMIIQGYYVGNNSEEPNEEDVLVLAKVSKIPGVCWACEWALKKVKKITGNNTKAEIIKAKLLSVCDQIGLLKSLCKKFVQSHLGVLIEELTTTDAVHKICVNTKACKSKESQMIGRYLEHAADLFDDSEE